MLLLDLHGHELSSEESEILRHPKVFGVILFAKNYNNINQVQNLIKAIRDVNSELLVTVDHEGGRVQRFKDGFTLLPSMAHFGELYDSNLNAARSELQTMALTTARELQSVGIDFNLAPVLDVNHDLKSVIGNRCIHYKSNVVSELGWVYISALHQAGMHAVAKHFPGHGGVQIDTHLGQAIDDREYSLLMQNDIAPFIHAISFGLEAIMAGHVIYKSIDNMPATASKFWLSDVLRQELKFAGVVISDDLNMQGAVTNLAVEERALAALDAGCDIGIICNNRPAAIKALESMSSYKNQASATRIQKFKRKLNPHLIT